MARPKSIEAARLDDTDLYEKARNALRGAVDAGGFEIDKDFDPFTEMCVLAAKPVLTASDKIKLDALDKVLSFLHPRKKAIEVAGKDGGPIKIEFAYEKTGEKEDGPIS